MIETLERRSLLAAATVTIIQTTDGSILQIFGTAKRDFISFGLSPDGTLFDYSIALGDGSGEVISQRNNSVADFKLISASLGDGADTLIMGELPIPLFARGGRGPDSISGGFGNDTMLGDGSNDYLFGREGNDSIVGGLQDDLMLGGRNDDVLFPNSTLSNDDTVSGGQGRDTVDYSTVTDNVTVNLNNDLPNPSEDDFIIGDVEVILGSPQNDTITNGTRRGMVIDGRGGNDTLTGGSGNDTITGGAGVDVINAVGGRDSIIADDGEIDTINGGRDSDTVTGDGNDVITNVP